MSIFCVHPYLDVFALDEGHSIASDDIIMCLNWTGKEAQILNIHALAPGEEMKQPRSVNTRLL